MDRVPKDTKKLIDDLRSAVDAARRTRETTQRLLHSTRRPAAPESTSEQPRLRRVSRW